MYDWFIAANGLLYFVGRESGTHDYYLMALQRSGEALWRHPAGSYWPFYSPVLVGDVFYLGSDDGVLQTLDAITGELLWSYSIPYSPGFEVAPADSYGLVYAAFGDGRLYAVNASTGDLAWRTSLFEGGAGSFAVADNTVVFRSDVVDTTLLFGLDAITGDFKWSREVPKHIDFDRIISMYDVIIVWPYWVLNASTGAKMPGFVEFENYNAEESVIPIYDGCRIYSMAGNGVFAADIRTGKTLWSISSNSSSQYHVPYALGEKGTIYITQEDHIVALNSTTGDELWRHRVLAGILGPIEYFEGVLYFPTLHDRLYAFDTSKRELLWQTPEYPSGTFNGGMTVVDGIIYFSRIRDLSAYKAEPRR